MSSLEILPSWILILYIFLFGLCIGSFLNVVILRGLSEEEIVFTRSKCPKCKTQLKWYMNIPLFSYIFLRGKCAYCKEKISVQYPIVELLTALLFIAIYYSFGITLKSLFLCIIISLFIVLCVTDILETVIITNHAYILTAVGIIFATLKLSDITLIESVIAAIAGFVIFEAISRLGYLFANMRMFGEGDSYIILGIGAIFGIKATLVIIGLSFLIQSLMALPLITNEAIKKKKIQLGISYISVAISILYIILVNFTNIIDEKYYTISAFIMAAMLVYCLFNIIKELNEKKKLIEKNLDENNEEDFETCKKTFTLLPFGPALVLSAVIFIFFGNYIIAGIKSFLF